MFSWHVLYPSSCRFLIASEDAIPHNTVGSGLLSNGLLSLARELLWPIELSVIMEMFYVSTVQ